MSVFFGVFVFFGGVFVLTFCFFVVPPPQANEPERPAEEQSYGDRLRQTAIEAAAQRRRVADVRSGGAAATLPRERRHGTSRVPAPWGVAPQQDALRGAIISYDSDGRCSYAATHKCHSSHNHWSRCLVVDHPDDAEFWGDVTEEYTPTRERKSLVDLVRCEM